jgi:hypothetical protein
MRRGQQTFSHRLRLRRFAYAYIESLGNASAAARRIGCQGKPESIRVTACRLLKQARAERLIDRILDRERVFDDLFARRAKC